MVVHAVDPDAHIRLERTLGILLGAPSCLEEMAPDRQLGVEEDQGSELAGDADAA